jgi:hypothetical protein
MGVDACVCVRVCCRHGCVLSSTRVCIVGGGGGWDVRS